MHFDFDAGETAQRSHESAVLDATRVGLVVEDQYHEGLV
jgi:hypothetical protein